MKLIELNKRERQEIYMNHLVKDFHESEVKSLDMIEKLIENDEYKCYGFFKDNNFLGYAYLVQPINSFDLLIDYLAVCNGSRSKGLGTQFISVLKDKFNRKYSSLLAEVEDPDYSKSEEDKVNRDRRISFYMRSGFELSSVKTHVLVDNYRIIKLNLNRELIDREVCEAMTEIYKTIFNADFYEKNIEVSV